jgi:hypothetical protein
MCLAVAAPGDMAGVVRRFCRLWSHGVPNVLYASRTSMLDRGFHAVLHTAHMMRHRPAGVHMFSARRHGAGVIRYLTRGLCRWSRLGSIGRLLVIGSRRALALRGILMFLHVATHLPKVALGHAPGNLPLQSTGTLSSVHRSRATCPYLLAHHFGCSIQFPP